ncbi:hypothetical protein [Undibacterium terreum]|uniref:FlxA-like protein n=1 Tax=Undibacterium terreum TaxID=1224302 RepID=A0A916U4T6_9BURK|nr:hypothetical protein [Undibacterium terreum]GGC60326.1 hypothetical protein GCM10011396_04000 [Undibacterium terreum]
MVQAITTSAGTGAAAASSGAASAALEAQLERYQKELSDCVNCASAKTPEGKAQIDDISSKISSLKTRIEKVGDARPGESTDGSASSTGKLQTQNKAGSTDSSSTNNTVNSAAHQAAAANLNQNTANGSARPGSASLTVGGFLDLYS